MYKCILITCLCSYILSAAPLLHKNTRTRPRRNSCAGNALRLMTWTNNFSKTFLIFASLIPFFRLIIPEKCFYQWILCHNFVYMKKFPWFLSFELGARQACDRRHRTMGTVHSGKISHLTWTFTKKYWAVLGCTGLYWAVLGHLRYLLGNVQVKWRILPLCTVVTLASFHWFCIMSPPTIHHQQCTVVKYATWPGHSLRGT